MKFSFSFHKNEKRPNGTLEAVEKLRFSSSLSIETTLSIES